MHLSSEYNTDMLIWIVLRNIIALVKLRTARRKVFFFFFFKPLAGVGHCQTKQQINWISAVAVLFIMALFSSIGNFNIQ